MPFSFCQIQSICIFGFCVSSFNTWTMCSNVYGEHFWIRRFHKKWSVIRHLFNLMWSELWQIFNCIKHVLNISECDCHRFVLLNAEHNHVCGKTSNGNLMLCDVNHLIRRKMVIFHFSKLKNNGLEISKHFVKFYASYVEHEMWLVGRQPKNDDKEMHLFYPKIVNAERIEHFFSSFVYDTETMQPKIAERMHQIIIYSELKFTMKIE